jgi:hypothetical protein
VSDAADLLDHHFEVILLGAVFTLLMVMIFVFNLLVRYRTLLDLPGGEL